MKKEEFKCIKYDYLDGDLICNYNDNYGEVLWCPKGYGVINFIHGHNLKKGIIFDNILFSDYIEEAVSNNCFFLEVNNIKKEIEENLEESERKFFMQVKECYDSIV